MTYEFQSAVTRGGNIVTPEKLVITDKFVQWSQNNGLRSLFLAKSAITIPRSVISGVEFDGKLIGADILIWTISGQSIFAKNFTTADAKQIKKLLLNQHI